VLRGETLVGVGWGGCFEDEGGEWGWCGGTGEDGGEDGYEEED
jgi:hypothetical protein